jgi:hypothetical protein
MSSHKKSNRFSRPAIERAATDRVPPSAKNFASFTMSETDIENVRGKTSKEILLHSPAGLALNLDNSVVPPGIYNDCHGHNFSIDLTPFEVSRLIYKPQGFVANISISVGKVNTGAKSQGGKIIIYPFIHFYPHQCVIDWYLSTVSHEEIRKQLDLPPEGKVEFTDVEWETVHVDRDGDVETPLYMSQSYSIRSAKVFRRGHGYQTIVNSIKKEWETWRLFKEPDIVEACIKYRFIPHVKYD